MLHHRHQSIGLAVVTSHATSSNISRCTSRNGTLSPFIITKFTQKSRLPGAQAITPIVARVFVHPWHPSALCAPSSCHIPFPFVFILTICILPKAPNTAYSTFRPPRFRVHCFIRGPRLVQSGDRGGKMVKRRMLVWDYRFTCASQGGGGWSGLRFPYRITRRRLCKDGGHSAAWA